MGAADAFVIWKVDRAARSTLDLLTFVQGLEDNGAEFASATEQFDMSTPMGRTMAGSRFSTASRGSKCAGRTVT